MNSQFFNFKASLKPDKQINGIIRSYSSLLTQKQLMVILQSYFKDYDFSNLSKYELHKVFNDIMCHLNFGELWIKYLLFNMFEYENAISAFEVNTIDSRLDFVRVNGFSFSYEIKSEIDSLTKLEKQILDYNQLFEYNYVVIDSKHFLKCIDIIPDNYGIYEVINGNLVQTKKAILNQYLNPQQQLNQFTSKEIKDIYKDKETSREDILNSSTPSLINQLFKKMLKNRFEKRFYFLKANKSNILPIDYQFFFKKNIEPNIIYNF